MSVRVAVCLFLFSSLSISALGQRGINEDKLRIYPNPVSEYIIIETATPLADVSFELNSMIGNKINIEVEQLGEDRYKIPVKNLSTGYYFLVVRSESARIKKAFKFLKE